MPQPPLQPEKRTIKRFSLNLPSLIRRRDGGAGDLEGMTRDVSSRGAYVYMQTAAREGSAIEFLMTLPTEITLAEPIHVLCSGRVVRSEPGAAKPGIAVAIEKYDFVDES